MDTPILPSDKLAYSIDQAVAAIGLSRDTLYRAMRAGQLKPKAAGVRTLITRGELQRYLDELPVLDLSAPAPGRRGRKRSAAA